MKITRLLVIAFLAAMVAGSISADGKRNAQGSRFDQPLDSTETSILRWMREEEKLARDVYRTLYGRWDDQIFLIIAGSEQRHMDAMKRMLALWDIDDPVVNDETGEFSDPAFDTLYQQFIDRGSESLSEALHVGAHVEELDIRDLRIALENTDEEPLLGAYRNLLAGARNHLRAFVARITALGITYQAQELSQEEVDAIIGDYDMPPPLPGNFSINPGLNDIWYYPGTDGQGFSISVFPGQKMVFLVWFTWDTLLPDENTVSRLGDPGQRWLTAQGPYSGAEALLEINMAGGGLFDERDPKPTIEPYGSILVRFENCNSGSLFYDLPSIGRTGMIPIQRVNPENVARCKAGP